jgi:hypothetical protein
MCNVLDFIVAKAAEDTVANYNWEIEVVQMQTRNFFQNNQSNTDRKNWSDTQFKVNTAGEYQGVTIHFYGLRASEAVTWREIGISYNIDTCEENFHKVAFLVSITPVAIESLKKHLRLWGDRMERAMNIAIDAKCRHNLAELREECHNRKRKEADKESKYLAYYTPDHDLECLIFILDSVLVGIN